MKILKLFEEMLDEFDPYGNEHGERVSELSGKLAERNGISRYSLLYRDIITGSKIHDIGKFKVPPPIRNLTRKYLEAEMEAMQKHPTYGAHFISVLINGDVSPIINERVVSFVLHHHQDWGGNGGYPLPQLKGEDIPIGAQIIRIPDTYDALTHERGYKHALTPFEALKEMEAYQIETEFANPTLLRLFLEMMRAR